MKANFAEERDIFNRMKSDIPNVVVTSHNWSGIEQMTKSLDAVC
jgi:hypothetical protein